MCLGDLGIVRYKMFSYFMDEIKWNNSKEFFLRGRIIHHRGEIPLASVCVTLTD